MQAPQFISLKELPEAQYIGKVHAALYGFSQKDVDEHVKAVVGMDMYNALTVQYVLGDIDTANGYGLRKLTENAVLSRDSQTIDNFYEAVLLSGAQVDLLIATLANKDDFLGEPGEDGHDLIQALSQAQEVFSTYNRDDLKAAFQASNASADLFENNDITEWPFFYDKHDVRLQSSEAPAIGFYGLVPDYLNDCWVARIYPGKEVGGLISQMFPDKIGTFADHESPAEWQELMLGIARNGMAEAKSWLRNIPVHLLEKEGALQDYRELVIAFLEAEHQFNTFTNMDLNDYYSSKDDFADEALAQQDISTRKYPLYHGFNRSMEAPTLAKMLKI